MSQSKKEIRKCKYGVVKHCAECKERFIATKWCGELTCQPCLDMAWLIDDNHITNLLFSCCPAHRPLVMDILIENHPCEIHDTATAADTTGSTLKATTTTGDTYSPTKPLSSTSLSIPKSKPIPIISDDNQSTTRSKRKSSAKQRSFVQSFHELLSNSNFF